MDSIFMSYRRVGTSGYGGRLHMDLRAHFGTSRVFRDIDSIPPGTDFFEVIEDAVARSRVVLVLIGRDWLTVTDVDGSRRIDDPDDFVRLELESAFRHEAVVIPVLVEQAPMPPSTALPASLVKLSRTQGIELSDERWEYDVGRLIARLEEIVGRGTLSPNGSSELPAATASYLADTTSAPAWIDQVEPAVVTGEEVGLGRRPWRRRRAVLSAIASVAVVAGGVMFDATAETVRPPRRPIPRVVDQDVGAASAVLRAAGFVVVTQDLIDDDKQASVVVEQDPADGTSAEKGSAVTLSVARGSGKVAVPRIVELRRPEADAMLKAAGLSGMFEEVASDAVPAGVVVAQSPDASAKVDKGSSVTAAVSTGPPATVPPQQPVATNATVAPARSSSASPRPTTAAPTPTSPTPTSPTPTVAATTASTAPPATVATTTPATTPRPAVACCGDSVTSGVGKATVTATSSP